MRGTGRAPADGLGFGEAPGAAAKVFEGVFDAEAAALKIDVPPAKGESFAEAEAAGEQESVQVFVAVAVRRGEEGGGCFRGQGSDGRAAAARRIDQ